MASIKRQILSKINRVMPLNVFRANKSPKILMYHRVINPEESLIPLEPGMYVTPTTFSMQIKYLKENFNVIPLEEHLNQKDFNNNNISITFDDAWHDFFDFAYPILKAYNLPASVFIPTSFISTNKLFWSDEVSLYLSKIKANKENLSKCQLKLNQENISLDLSEPNFKIISSIKPKINKSEIINILSDYSNLDINQLPSQFMSWEQIRKIQSEGLVSFGDHSYSHYISDQIYDYELKEDLLKSKSKLNQENINPINIFCYPNQSRNNNTDKVLNSLGFKASLGKLLKNEDKMQIMPTCYERIGIHNDISNTIDLFRLRLTGV